MALYNQHFDSLKDSYLFSEISRRVAEYQTQNPDKSKRLIRLGIGDVTKPLAPAVVTAMQKAARELGRAETFRGYEDSGRGYPFLREAVANYYSGFNIKIDSEEIFISDGAKSDCGNIGDIFAENNTVLVTDPVYPVYVDVNLMAGRKIVYAAGNETNGFAPAPDDSVRADIIYLCSPNNPTGAVFTKDQLQKWVDYALKNSAVIVFDAAYESFIADESLPRSIFTIPDARRCAVEICSLSKTAGFTGTRCGYTVIPKELSVSDDLGNKKSLISLWKRRQGSKFNGVSYPVQRAAEAVFSPEGLRECRETLAYYRENSKIITDTFDRLSVTYTGGKHSPYVWFKSPFSAQQSSWELFDYLLREIQVIGTPGSGFGGSGEGWFRLTAFGTHELTKEAMQRLEKII